MSIVTDYFKGPQIASTEVASVEDLDTRLSRDDNSIFISDEKLNEMLPKIIGDLGLDELDDFNRRKAIIRMRKATGAGRDEPLGRVLYAAYNLAGGPEGLAEKIVKGGAPSRASHWRVLRKAMGDKYKFEEPEEWDEDTLNRWAQHVYNYHYKYKPGIGEDPNKMHYGTMAQDLEAAGSTAVEEEGGVKKVDTGRLALETAGVAADMARVLKDKGIL